MRITTTTFFLQERDQIIQDEIARLEKLQKLAEKVAKECTSTDARLDDIEAWIEDEAKRIDQLHPKVMKKGGLLRVLIMPYVRTCSFFHFHFKSNFTR